MTQEIEPPPILRPKPLSLAARPALMSVSVMPRRRVGARWPNRRSSLLLLAMAGAWVALGVWAAVGRVDTFTSGMGRVVPAQNVQTIQTFEGGVLAELSVAEGTIVQEGQVVARVSDVAAVSEYQQLRAKYLGTFAAIVRLEAELTRRTPETPVELQGPEGKPFADREAELFRARMSELQSSVSVIQRQRDQRREELHGVEERARGLRDWLIPLRQELTLTQDLVASGHKPRLELIRMEQRVGDTDSQLRAAMGQIPALQAGIREAEQRIDERQKTFDSQTRADLSQRHTELAGAVEALRNLRDRVERRDLRSPVHGEVKQIRVKTIGGVLQSGQVLMEIVPVGDSLMVEVPIQPSDIAFVVQGMPARVKVTAYEHTLHGWLPGKVELISADAIVNEKGEAFFQVRVRPEKTSLGTPDRPLPVLPGMMASVDIVTGNRTVLAYLLKPVIKAVDHALSER